MTKWDHNRPIKGLKLKLYDGIEIEQRTKSNQQSSAIPGGMQ